MSDSDNSRPGGPADSSSYPRQPPLPLRLAPTVAATSVQISAHAGPLPPPQQFAAYEDVHPGAAAWILAQAEANAAHAREMDRRMLAFQARDGLLHRVLPFALVALLVAVSGVMAVFASKVLGGAAFFATLAGVVTVYLRGGQTSAGPTGGAAAAPRHEGRATRAAPPDA